MGDVTARGKLLPRLRRNERLGKTALAITTLSCARRTAACAPATCPARARTTTRSFPWATRSPCDRAAASAASGPLCLRDNDLGKTRVERRGELRRERVRAEAAARQVGLPGRARTRLDEDSNKRSDEEQAPFHARVIDATRCRLDTRSGVWSWPANSRSSGRSPACRPSRRGRQPRARSRTRRRSARTRATTARPMQSRFRRR